MGPNSWRAVSHRTSACRGVIVPFIFPTWFEAESLSFTRDRFVYDTPAGCFVPAEQSHCPCYTPSLIAIGRCAGWGSSAIFPPTQPHTPQARHSKIWCFLCGQQRAMLVFSPSTLARLDATALRHAGWFLGGPPQSQELDMMVLMGAFQLGIFCDSWAHNCP